MDSPADSAAPPPRRAGLAGLIGTAIAFAAGAGAGGVGAAIGVSQFGGGGHAGAAPAAAAHEPVEYVELDNAFTSNLVDTGRYLQIRLSVSTTGGEAVVGAIKLHKPALVSAVLAVLGDLAEADVADARTKDKVRGRLKAALNTTLAAKGVAGGIDEVFFTSLVVQ